MLQKNSTSLNVTAHKHYLNVYTSLIMLQIQSDCGVKDCYVYPHIHLVINMLSFLKDRIAANMFTLRRDKRVRVEYGTQLRTKLRRAKQ